MQFLVLASDQRNPPKIRNATMTIRIRPNQAPVFTNLPLTTTIFENVPVDSLVMRVTATDSDIRVSVHLMFQSVTIFISNYRGTYILYYYFVSIRVDFKQTWFFFLQTGSRLVYMLVGDGSAPTYFTVNNVTGEVRTKESIRNDTTMQYVVSLGTDWYIGNILYHAT